jgi:TolB protein
MTPRTNGPAFPSPVALARCAGLCAAVVFAAGCSTASRTTARGWEYGADANSETTEVAGVGQVRSVPRGQTINTRVWHDPVARHAPPRTMDQSQPAPKAGASMSVALAAAEVSISEPTTPTRTLPTTTRPSDLPNIHEPFDTTATNTLLDAAPGLCQVTFAGEGAAFDPCISSDGRLLAFAGTHHRPTADIYTVPVGGSSVTQLTSDPAHDIMPAISPDGSRIAFASNRSGNWDIFVMSSSGGQALQLTSDPTSELHPTWSPDGQRIAFCRLGQVSGRWELWVQEVANPRSAEFIGYGLYPRWCPVSGTGHDGRDRIVFQRARERGDRAYSVWTVDYRPGDVTSPTEVASSPTEALINPAWSADGRWITYAAVPNPGEASAAGRIGEADLWIVAADGSARVNLTAGTFVNLAPTWAADGRIYFVSNRAGVDNIWSISTDRAIAAATGSRGNTPTETAQAPRHADPLHGPQIPRTGTDAYDATAHVPTP